MAGPLAQLVEHPAHSASRVAVSATDIHRDWLPPASTAWSSRGMRNRAVLGSSPRRPTLPSWCNWQTHESSLTPVPVVNPLTPHRLHLVSRTQTSGSNPGEGTAPERVHIAVPLGVVVAHTSISVSEGYSPSYVGS